MLPLSAPTNAGLRILSIVFNSTISTATGGGLAVVVAGKDTAGAIGNTTATLAGSEEQGRLTYAFPAGGGSASTWVPRITFH